MDFDNEIVFRIPAPSDGIETVLVLFGIAAVLVAVLAGFQHRETLARRIDWLKKHPWEKASTPVNLLSWVTLISVGPVAAILFVMAVDEAYALLQQTGGSESSAGSLGRGAVIVALIGAPFVIWRSVVAQKTVTLQEQGHITDRINTAVQGLGAEKTVRRQRKRQTGKLAYVKGEDGKPDYSQPIMEEVTQPNLEVRIGAIYALERIAQDSDRDHVQIMEILCAYIRQNAPAPKTNEWPDPELEINESEEEGSVEADWLNRRKMIRLGLQQAGLGPKPRTDIQVALTVIGRRTPKQRRLEAGRGVEAEFPFDLPCPFYEGDHNTPDFEELRAFSKNLNLWIHRLNNYEGFRIDLRQTDLRGADLTRLNLNGVRLSGAHLQWACLQATELKGANLFKAQLNKAILSNVKLQGTALFMVNLQEVFLDYARAEGSNLTASNLAGAALFNARFQNAAFPMAILHGAEFNAAHMQGTDLRGAHLDVETALSGAILHGAAIKKIECAETSLTMDDLTTMFGDASVSLPSGYGPDHKSWPAHWPKFDLGGDFDEEWRKWRDNPKRYRLPKSRASTGSE